VGGDSISVPVAAERHVGSAGSETSALANQVHVGASTRAITLQVPFVSSCHQALAPSVVKGVHAVCHCCASTTGMEPTGVGDIMGCMCVWVNHPGFCMCHDCCTGVCLGRRRVLGVQVWHRQSYVDEAHCMS